MDSKRIYMKIFEGNTVTIRCGSFSEFNSLRVQLSKQQKMMKEIGGSEAALIAKWNEEEGTATYKLGPRKPAVQFEIISIEPDKEEGDAQVSGSLDEDSSQGESSNPLSEVSNQDNISGDIQGEIPEQSASQESWAARIWKDQHRD